MNITFEWTLANGESLPEDQLLTRIAEVRALDAQHLREGTIVLPGIKGGSPIRLSDELGAIAVRLFIEAPKDLIADRPATIEFFASDAILTLSPNGKNIEFSGGGFSAVRYLKADFVQALVDAATRFVGFLRALHEGEAGWLEYADKLEALTAENRTALRGAISSTSSTKSPPVRSNKRPAKRKQSGRKQ